MVVAMLRVYFFIATALIEAGAGLLLVLFPSMPLVLLLGVSQVSAEASVIARVAGAALLALGVACWLARKDSVSRAASGLIVAMLLYNISVGAILVFAAIVDGLHGIALWPGVALHVAMAIWCLACLRGTR
jgi:hypothetical protein